jgi:integrase
VRVLDAKLAESKLGAPTRRKVQIVLRSILCKFAVEAKLLPDAPKMPRMPKKSKKIPQVISAEQANRIIAATLTSEHRLALLLAFHAGLRGGEIRALRVDDVDLEENVLVVDESEFRGEYGTPKSGHDRKIPLTRALRVALSEAIQGRSRRAFVALSSHGEPWGQHGLRGMFLRVAKRAGITEGATFHHLRHGFVTALLDRGVGAHIVQELAGHADLTTTQRYAHAIAKQKHRAIDVLNEADEAPAHGDAPKVDEEGMDMDAVAAE